MIAPDSLLPHLQRALAGRYVLERPLGRGGMGYVYLAREVRLDRRVAIKVLPPEKALEAGARELFLREARTAARLSHPNVVPIFAVHEADGFVCFAMAYVQGETLGQRVRGSGPLGYAEGGRVLRDVARALAYAHAHGVVHRDVKPDNILLDAATGRALVSDFGIAWIESGANTGPRRLLGTAEFMSPEQARGQAVDGRSDLYSLGVVGFYALSGRLPFEGPDAMAVLARHLADPPPSLEGLAPAVPRPLAAVVTRCLAKEPDARFPTGEALGEAIARALRDQEVPAVAVRAFVTEGRHLSTLTHLYAALAAVAVPVLASYVATSGDLGVRAGAAALGALVAGLPIAIQVARVRGLVARGFVREDLIHALRAAFEQRREELAFLYGEGPSRLERTLRRVSYAACAAAAGAVAAVQWRPGLAARPLVPLAAGAAGAIALLAALAARARTEHRTDPKAGRRLRFWTGPLGRWLFALAGLGLARPGEQRAAPLGLKPAPAAAATPAAAPAPATSPTP